MRILVGSLAVPALVSLLDCSTSGADSSDVFVERAPVVEADLRTMSLLQVCSAMLASHTIHSSNCSAVGVDCTAHG